MLEALLRHDRLVLVAALAAIVALAWCWLLAGAGMEMGAIEMTAMAGMDGWLMQPAVWSPPYAALIFSMWWVMMVAMMLPSAAPTLLLFARVNRKDKAAAAALTSTVFFAAGYLLAWGGFCAFATALQWGLESTRLLSPMLATTSHWLGAGILLVAGLWQLTPFKPVCLRHCRTPLGLPDRQLAGGPARRVAHGAEARRLLPRLLLVPDDASVLRRCDEPLLGRRPCSLRAAGEVYSARPLARPRERARAGRLGDGAGDAGDQLNSRRPVSPVV